MCLENISLNQNGFILEPFPRLENLLQIAHSIDSSWLMQVFPSSSW
jgi:hypothetical protein